MARLVCALFILFASLHFHPLVASAQAYAGGDLDGQAVFGPPAQEIIAVTSDAVSNATFPIKGHTTPIPGGPTDGTGSQLPGWSIFIGVAANVDRSRRQMTPRHQRMTIDLQFLPRHLCRQEEQRLGVCER
ncbi:hypothetical protein B0T24DRAFT_592984 [Lasiosphaeria ovina]|uniref:Uncharacterized protein n=1 Tax=Lasiosphaeria ovina TaxID=92902 RepID=A0AAE0KK64_9PEZI|nr:hypothetical protein B0T24DRAFT_592984 [Lasiosphaeria ovina]